jgi:hypothetical protein
MTPPAVHLTPAQRRRAERVAVRQERLIELARTVAPMAGKSLDDNDVRAILAAVVRRWSTTVSVDFMSEEVWGGERSHLEHVVPVRVIVDRMIARPRAVERILRTAVVVAKVTPAQHSSIGTMLGTHAALYEHMKKCRLDELPAQGWHRYRRRGVRVVDVNGRTPWRRS